MLWRYYFGGLACCSGTIWSWSWREISWSWLKGCIGERLMPLPNTPPPLMPMQPYHGVPMLHIAMRGRFEQGALLKKKLSPDKPHEVLWGSLDLHQLCHETVSAVLLFHPLPPQPDHSMLHSMTLKGRCTVEIPVPIAIGVGCLRVRGASSCGQSWVDILFVQLICAISHLFTQPRG